MTDRAPAESLLRILDLTQKLAVPHELSAMLAEVMDAGRAVLNAESGSLWLYDPEQDVIHMHLPVVDSGISVSGGQGIVGECLAANRVINVPDCYADPRFNSAVDKWTGFKTRSLISIPLVGIHDTRVGVLQLLNKKGGGPFDQEDEQIARALAAQSAVALQRAQAMDSMIAKERLDEEIAVAREVQMSALPESMPVLDGYEFASGFIPAAHTGGDMFDLVRLDDEVFVLVGDATGHGVGPALSATQMLAMFRVAFRVGASLDDAYIHVNNQLVEDLQDSKFLTAFVGFLNSESHTLRYHSAGQGPLLHYRAAEDRCDVHGPTSFPVGVMEFYEVSPARVVAMGKGDIFAVISDGVFEHENEAGEQFGEERVSKLVKEFRGNDLGELRQRILDRLAEFAGGAEQVDDITIVLIRREEGH